MQNLLCSDIYHELYHELCSILLLECVKVRIHLVCLDGVLHLLYLPDGRNYVLFGRKKPDVGM